MGFQIDVKSSDGPVVIVQIIAHDYYDPIIDVIIQLC